MSDQRKIDITKLEPEQIDQLRKQFESELEHFGTSLSALQVALNRYKECIANITQISTPENSNQEILVPLSSSLYVPGKVKDNQKFLVDVGTGYYIEKSAENAKVFYEGKVKQLEEDKAKVAAIIREKQGTLQRVNEILREKVIAHQQAQAQAQAQAQKK